MKANNEYCTPQFLRQLGQYIMDSTETNTDEASWDLQFDHWDGIEIDGVQYELNGEAGGTFHTEKGDYWTPDYTEKYVCGCNIDVRVFDGEFAEEPSAEFVVTLTMLENYL